MPVVRSRSQEAGQSPAGEHPVDGRTRYTQPSGHQMGAFFLGDPIRNDLFLHLQRDPIGTVVRPDWSDPPVRPLLPPASVSSTDRRSAGTLPPTQRLGPPANPTRRSDPPTTCVQTASTLPYSIPLRASSDSRNVAYPQIKPGGPHSSKHLSTTSVGRTCVFELVLAAPVGMALKNVPCPFWGGGFLGECLLTGEPGLVMSLDRSVMTLI